jgi:putative endopeptidase
MGKAREETAQMLLAVDPHSPQEPAANAVRNIDEFHAAFDVSPATACGCARGSRPASSDGSF